MNLGKPSASKPVFAIVLLLGGLLLRLPGLGSSVNFVSYTNLFAVFTEDGGFPRGSRALGSDGATLFGTTLQGDGKVGLWGGFRQFVSFSGNLGGLLLGKDGILYRTTSGGGVTNLGTIYRIGQDGNGYHVIHRFEVSTADTED